MERVRWMHNTWRITKTDVGLSILCGCLEAVGLFLVLRWVAGKADGRPHLVRRLVSRA